MITASPNRGGRKQRRRFVKKVLELLYLTEFIVFIEYTEVIVPVIYRVYSILLSCMWNREYYTFLQNWSSNSLVDQFTNISLYVLAEALPLVLMAVVLWWHLRFSLVHQLAFNLETRQVHIQSKLVGWVIYIVQNAMVQFGADYSFRFEWLRASSRGPQKHSKGSLPFTPKRGRAEISHITEDSSSPSYDRRAAAIVNLAHT
ncbi:hypothetical protein Poli38472_004754 [Pythium oligandrum]|uniref:Uncharacterized protein n=1 Tax=Pythium oligandrum TaxID=41045 RepID=A0A8K1FDR1_PYTOL|nr:hypothetical protein Poli38472_004754 [Pythium oligandrum]|eukprot:TMW59685.1 hypothetical protein Poli38472_004754 [Pythium oligandrum]